MNLATIEKIRDELAALLNGRRFGKVFPLLRNAFAVDLRLSESRYLFVSVDTADPRTYLIRRRLRDLERASVSPPPFVMILRKYLSGLEVEEVEQVAGERVLVFILSGESETGRASYRLVVQLTGRSANVFLTDERGFIISSLRETEGDGQQSGTRYSPPNRPDGAAPPRGDVIPAEGFATLSEALDAADLIRSAERDFAAAAGAARARVKKEMSKRERLLGRLNTDLDEHGDAEIWKRYGDLLLANISNARREGTKVFLTDYFDEDQSTIEIEADENDTISSAAEKYFKRYTKARNARGEIQKRREALRIELKDLQARSAEIEEAISDGDIQRLRELAGQKQAPKERSRNKVSGSSAVARIFTSSDGYEILVGRRAKDNDQLTFRIARSLDTWMHAADYPGSHVIVRNPNRGEIPQRTLHEAAQLAAFYSQGKSQPKAAVHYTQKKFVNKPKGSAPGLVSLASFKTLLVEPKVPGSVTNQGTG